MIPVSNVCYLPGGSQVSNNGVSSGKKPKKQPHNSFYYYMIDFRAEMKEKGINYRNMQEVASAAGPQWANLNFVSLPDHWPSEKKSPKISKSLQSVPPHIRKTYEERAKTEKERFKLPSNKFTCTGTSLAELEALEIEKQQIEEAMIHDIQNFVDKCYSNGSLKKKFIYLLDVNSYCKYNNFKYLIGEVSVVRFCIEDGVVDDYHKLINPGFMPHGYWTEVKIGAKEFGLEMPWETTSATNYIQVLQDIIDFLRTAEPDCSILPPFYAKAEKMDEVQYFIEELCFKADVDSAQFRVYCLDNLLFTLIKTIRGKEKDEDGLDRVEMVSSYLSRNPSWYATGLSCKYHDEIDKTSACTLTRTKRWCLMIQEKTNKQEGASVRSTVSNSNATNKFINVSSKSSILSRQLAKLTMKDLPKVGDPVPMAPPLAKGRGANSVELSSSNSSMLGEFRISAGRGQGRYRTADENIEWDD